VQMMSSSESFSSSRVIDFDKLI